MAEYPKHFRGHVAQKAILHHEGKVLVVLNHGEDIWDLPGGHMDQGEHPLHGIKREILEETNLSVDTCDLIGVDTFTDTRSGEQYVLLIYKAEAPHADIIPQDEELSEARWISKEDLSSITLYPEYQRVIEGFFGDN